MNKLKFVMTELQRAIEAELERKDGPQFTLDLGGDQPGKQQRERDLPPCTGASRKFPMKSNVNLPTFVPVFATPARGCSLSRLPG